MEGAMAENDDQAGTDGSPAGWGWSLFLGFYLLFLSAVSIGLAVKMWPNCTQEPCSAIALTLGRVTVPLGNPTQEERLFWTAVLFGAIGSYIHVAASFADYVGNRRLMVSWIWWFVLRTPIGIALAIVFYAAIRAGFLTANAGNGGADVNPYGIAAISAMAGMFSKQATDKLNEVFSTLFNTTGDQKRGDKLSPSNAPKIDLVTPTRSAGNLYSLAIKGSGFNALAKVKVNATEFTPSAVTPTDITVTLNGLTLTVGDTINVVVKNPADAGGESKPYPVAVP